MKIINRPPAKKARTLTIYTIKNGEVVETNLYDHVMQFVEFITTRYGSRPAMSIAGRIGDFYIQKKQGKLSLSTIMNFWRKRNSANTGIHIKM